MIENHPFASLSIGATSSLTRDCGARTRALFAASLGIAESLPAGEGFAAAMVSACITTVLPGLGTTISRLDLRAVADMPAQGEVTATVTVRALAPSRHVTLSCLVTEASGRVVMDGVAEAEAPEQAIAAEPGDMPDIRITTHHRFQDLIALAARMGPSRAAVVHPCDAASLSGALDAAEAGLVVPVLVGPDAKIRAVAESLGRSLDGIEIVAVPHSHAAAAEAVRLVRAGGAAMLVKGSLHSDELLAEVVAHETGLRTARRISHVFVMDVPSYPRLLLVTDAAVNIAPDLAQKRDIVQNAIDLGLALGVATPRVAILSAVEMVTESMRSTLDAAALCKMADRGQISGGFLDGPLAFDNAVSMEAARDKGIVSEVAGRADILVVPDIESGNMLAKQLTFMAGADAAGVVLGARVPIVLTSRADSARARVASCAVALLMARVSA